MKLFLLLIFCFFIISCNQQVADTNSPEPVNIAEVKFNPTKMALVGESRSTANDWIEYTRFETALENYDHSVSATEQLASITVDMGASIPSVLDNQPIRSRILVLQTRIKSYLSFLKHTAKTAKEYQQFYNAVTLAHDNLIGQMNEVFLRELQMRELIEDLKGDLQDLNSIETDTIP